LGRRHAVGGAGRYRPQRRDRPGGGVVAPAAVGQRPQRCAREAGPRLRRRILRRPCLRGENGRSRGCRRRQAGQEAVMIKVLNQYFPRRWAVLLLSESLLILLALTAAV